MKVIIEIPDKVYENAKNGMLDELQSMLICGSVTEGKPLPKDATNGDMFKTMFPNVGFGEFMDGIMILKDNECEFWHNWWDAPYMESEGD